MNAFAVANNHIFHAVALDQVAGHFVIVSRIKLLNVLLALLKLINLVDLIRKTPPLSLVAGPPENG